MFWGSLENHMRAVRSLVWWSSFMIMKNPTSAPEGFMFIASRPGRYCVHRFFNGFILFRISFDKKGGNESQQMDSRGIRAAMRIQNEFDGNLIDLKGQKSQRC